MHVTRQDDLRQQALKKLQELEVLMRDGHFDYGNGFHGRVYLNPHSCSCIRRRSGVSRRICSTSLPARAARADRRRGGTGDRRRAARAHARGAARRPPRADASALQLRAVHQRRTTDSSCASFYARRMEGQRVLLADDVRNTGKTFSGAPSS